MLQIQRHQNRLSAPEAKTEISKAIADHHRSMEANAHQFQTLGFSATLDDKGLRSVSNSRCEFEMELYLRRVLDKLELEICDEKGLFRLLRDAVEYQEFAALSKHIANFTAPAECAFVATPGSCTEEARSAQCVHDLVLTSHRRRQCTVRIQRPRLALAQALPWQCHLYLEGQNDEWCSRAPIEAGVEYSFNGGQFDQCGGCWCCKREAPKSLLVEGESVWKCHIYAEGQNDEWCSQAPREGGFQYSHSGGRSDQCGGCSCCKREAPPSLLLQSELAWQCHRYSEGQNDDWCKNSPIEEGIEYSFNDGRFNQCGGCWCCKRDAFKSQPVTEQTTAEETVLTAKLHAWGQNEKCPLPRGAVWCETHLKDLPSFWMAVYDWDVAEDWVSYNICHEGYWEEQDMSEFGTPGHMLDIGGNIGFYAFAFAQAGWTVTTFEPMETNTALMNATLCRNPDLAQRVRLNAFGLGATTHQCRMMSPQSNVGDGFTRCDDEEEGTVLQENENTFKEVGHFIVRRLDEVLLEQGITHVDLVKIDVEGHESQVFAGAPNFLEQYRPRLIKSEAWQFMVGSTGPTSGYDYLAMFERAGYKAFDDNKCQKAIDSKAEMDSRHAIDVVYCM